MRHLLIAAILILLPSLASAHTNHRYCYHHRHYGVHLSYRHRIHYNHYAHRGYHRHYYGRSNAYSPRFVRASQFRQAMRSYGAQVVAHPSGCPWRLFCGCGVSERVFGHPVRDLYLVRNWLRFPRGRAEPGNVVLFGVRHIAYIMQTYGDGTAMLYDPNSGGRLTRIHRMNIAWADIRNPRGGRLASYW